MDRGGRGEINGKLTLTCLVFYLPPDLSSVLSCSSCRHMQTRLVRSPWELELSPLRYGSIVLHRRSHHSTKEYHTHAGSELLSDVENVTSNLPEHNHGQAVKLIQESLKDNLKISEVINLIHNEALQDLPNIRQKFFIR